MFRIASRAYATTFRAGGGGSFSDEINTVRLLSVQAYFLRAVGRFGIANLWVRRIVSNEHSQRAYLHYQQASVLGVSLHSLLTGVLYYKFVAK